MTIKLYVNELGFVRDIHGKVSLIFACQSLVNMVLLLNPTELHAGATFKVVPSKLWSRQLLVIHFMVDNYASLRKLFQYISFAP